MEETATVGGAVRYYLPHCATGGCRAPHYLKITTDRNDCLAVINESQLCHLAQMAAPLPEALAVGIPHGHVTLGGAGSNQLPVC